MRRVSTSLAVKIRSWTNQVIGSIRILPSVCATLIFRTHVNRWRKVAHAGPPSWDGRNKLIAAAIPAGSSVLDVGCGAQTLRGYLQPGCKYQPCDVIKSTPDVILCDFNAGEYPDPALRFDYVVCSGVFEYIRKPAEFLTRIPRLGGTVLFSYNLYQAGGSKMPRLANNWVNHFTEEELHDLFRQNGLDWAVLATESKEHLIYTLRVSNHAKA